MEKVTKLIIDSGCFHQGFLEQMNAFGIPNIVFKTIFYYCSRFSCFDFCICWDSNKSKRKEAFKNYKNRKKAANVSEDSITQFKNGLNYCRKVLLPSVGMNNNYFASGYEADDLIASVINAFPPKENEHYIIISSDEDMYQLISDQISIYQPNKKRIVDFSLFCSEYGIEPWHWASVKAIAGCSSDCVPGILEWKSKKTGEKYAIQAISHGEFENLNTVFHEKLSRNFKLVELPYEGTPSPEKWTKCKITEEIFADLIEKENLDYFKTKSGEIRYKSFFSSMKTSIAKRSIKMKMRH